MLKMQGFGAFRMQSCTEIPVLERVIKIFHDSIGKLAYSAFSIDSVDIAPAGSAVMRFEASELDVRPT